jgi:hypothetical protein
MLTSNRYIIYNKRHYFNFTSQNLFLLCFYCKYNNIEYKYSVRTGSVTDCIALYLKDDKLILGSCYFYSSKVDRANNIIIKKVLMKLLSV